MHKKCDGGGCTRKKKLYVKDGEIGGARKVVDEMNTSKRAVKESLKEDPRR